jgi:integrase
VVHGVVHTVSSWPMSTEHLQKRKDTYFVRMRVPPHLRSWLPDPYQGKHEFIRTLKTSSLTEARHRRDRVVADLRDIIGHAERAWQSTQHHAKPDSSAYVTQSAVELRSIGQSASDAELAHDATVERHLDLLRKRHGEDDEGNPLVSDTHASVIRSSYRVLAGEPVALLSIQVDNYLRLLRGKPADKRPRNQTLAEKVKAFDEFKAWLIDDVEVTAITRKVASRYLREKLLTRHVSVQTTKGTLSHLRTLWAWMLDGDLVESNPWNDLGKQDLKVSRRGKERSRRAWTDDELLALMKAIPKDDPLFPLVGIAAYTGARREEICLLRKSDVTAAHMLKIREGKSQSAVRTVPIHAALRPLIARLVKTSTDDYLINGLLTGGMDNKRGHYLGKRFGYFIRQNGFTDTKLKFHTFRNTVAQRMEAAGVVLETAKQIIGHERDDLTYGGYSEGVGEKELTKAVQQITLGALDEYLKTAAAKVKVTKQSHRRPERTKGGKAI